MLAVTLRFPRHKQALLRVPTRTAALNFFPPPAAEIATGIVVNVTEE
jgi:hypothetical protein